MQKERIQYIDIAKGIGIAFVVLAHAKFPLNYFVTMFYLPMFFLLSGYFYSNNMGYLDYISKKTKQLYLKFIETGIILLLLHNVFLKIGFYSNHIPLGIQSNFMNNIPAYNIADFVKSFCNILLLGVPEQLMRPMWFIGALWISLVVLKSIDYCVFRRLNNIYVESITIIVLFFIGYYCPLPSFVGQGLVALLFCWLGYQAKKNHIFDVLLSLNKKYLVLIMLMGVAICSVASLKTDLIMMANTYTAWWSLFISSIAGISFMIIGCKWLERTLLGDTFSYIGKHTIAILSMHMISFKIVNYCIIQLTDMDGIFMAAYPIIDKDWWWFYSIVGISIPLLISYVYNLLLSLIQHGK